MEQLNGSLETLGLASVGFITHSTAQYLFGLLGRRAGEDPLVLLPLPEGRELASGLIQFRH
jgi:hypothetical protein